MFARRVKRDRSTAALRDCRAHYPHSLAREHVLAVLVSRVSCTGSIVATIELRSLLLAHFTIVGKRYFHASSLPSNALL